MVKKVFNVLLYVLACILAMIILVGCIYIFKYNIKNNIDFLKTPLSTLLTLFTGIVISFYLVQRKNDSRRKIDNIDKIINKVQADVNNTQLIDASSQSATNIALLKQKSLASRLEYINKHCPKNIKKDLDYIMGQFLQLRELYGGHFMDQEYIVKSSDDFKKYITNIDDKCDAIHINLYS